MQSASLKISRKVLDDIMAHAGRENPIEACGYLAERDGAVCRHYELTNTDQSGEHFTMEPAEQFAAIKEMREQGLRLRAVYHSHPETPARPSDEDIRLAHDPGISYVIVSLVAGEKEPIKSFRIQQGEVRQEPLEIIQP